jgi:hypothetical protein
MRQGSNTPFDLRQQGRATPFATSIPPSLQEAEHVAQEEEAKKRDSIMGSMLRFEDEVKSNKNEVKLFVASDKHLTIVWKEKTVDAFLNFASTMSSIICVTIP